MKAIAAKITLWTLMAFNLVLWTGLGLVFSIFLECCFNNTSLF